MTHWQSRLRSIAASVAQIVLLWVISEAAGRAAAVLPLPVPSGALGLLLLYGLLGAGWLRLEWIDGGAGFLVRHLGLFLVPFGVGFITFGETLAARGVVLAVVLIACTACGIAAAGLASGFIRGLARPDRAIGRSVHP